MGILEVPRNDRDFEDKSENDEVAQEDNVEEGNYYRFIAIEILYFYLTINTQLWLKWEMQEKTLHFLFDIELCHTSHLAKNTKGCFWTWKRNNFS